jgi:hypothetical protein
MPPPVDTRTLGFLSPGSTADDSGEDEEEEEDEDEESQPGGHTGRLDMGGEGEGQPDQEPGVPRPERPGQGAKRGAEKPPALEDPAKRLKELRGGSGKPTSAAADLASAVVYQADRQAEAQKPMHDAVARFFDAQAHRETAQAHRETQAGSASETSEFRELCQMERESLSRGEEPDEYVKGKLAHLRSKYTA